MPLFLKKRKNNLFSTDDPLKNIPAGKKVLQRIKKKGAYEAILAGFIPW